MDTVFCPIIGDEVTPIYCADSLSAGKSACKKCPHSPVKEKNPDPPTFKKPIRDSKPSQTGGQKEKPERTGPISISQALEQTHGVSGFYSVDDYDRLNHLKEGSGTKALTEMFSENIVRCGIRVFRIMRELEGKINNSPGFNEEMRGIKKLGAIKEISAAALEAEREAVYRRLHKSPEWPAIARWIAFKEGHSRKRGYPTDFALNILVYFLVSRLYNEKGKPHYSIVASFLSEQDITEKLADADVLKRKNRHPVRVLREYYNLMRGIYIAPGFLTSDPSALGCHAFESVKKLQLVAVDKPTDECDTLFPPSKQFFPKKTKNIACQPKTS